MALSQATRMALGVGTGAAWIAAAMFLAPGCVTAPPPDLPPTIERRPTILQDAVSPPASQILYVWPPDDTFSVPVELGDPSDGFTWQVFVDYDPLTNANAQMVNRSVVIDAGVATLSFQLNQPSPVGCHRIEFLVAHGFAKLADGSVLAHTPDAVGGDEVTWFYVPGGDPSNCSMSDAGFSPLPDAQSDGPTP